MRVCKVRYCTFLRIYALWRYWARVWFNGSPQQAAQPVEDKVTMYINK
jgi:hypothetical protein